MFNFKSKFERSPNTSKGYGYGAEVLEGQMIEDKDAFLKIFSEAQVQFSEVAKAIDGFMTLEEIRKFNKDIKYYTFLKYLEKEEHFVSGNLLNDDTYSALIAEYDRLIKVMKDFTFHTEGELKSFLKEAENLFDEVNSK